MKRLTGYRRFKPSDDLLVMFYRMEMAHPVHLCIGFFPELRGLYGVYL